MDDREIERWIERAQRFFEREPLRRLFSPERAAAAARAAFPPGAEERAAARFAERFDEAVARLRASGESAASFLGSAATEDLVRAAGAIEPDDRFVRALFAGPAAEALVATILYEGIVEFVRKMNALGEALPGVSIAKRLGSGFFSGLMGGAVEKAIEQQARAFIRGFVKIALERGVAFVTSPANRPLFREAAERIARLVLERPARELLAGVPPERLRDFRDAAARLYGRGLARLASNAGWLFERAGAASAMELLDRFGAPRLDPRETAKLFAPAIRLFLEAEKGALPPYSSEKTAPPQSS